MDKETKKKVVYVLSVCILGVLAILLVPEIFKLMA